MNQSALALFKTLPETKSEVEKYTRIIRDEVLEGNINPLSFITTVTALEKLFGNLKSDIMIKDMVLEEAEKYGQKTFVHGNAQFQVKEVGTKYDFTNCDDDQWRRLNADITALSIIKKEREDFLKTIKPDMEVYGADGTRLNPVSKTSTTSVVTILK